MTDAISRFKKAFVYLIFDLILENSNYSLFICCGVFLAVL